MKTAMQDVLGLVEQMFANARTKEVESAMNDVINIITQQGLVREKEQIKEAWYNGGVNGMGLFETNTGEEYYDKNYKNEG